MLGWISIEVGFYCPLFEYMLEGPTLIKQHLGSKKKTARFFICCNLEKINTEEPFYLP
jgi:hypothetical protein